VDLSKKIGRFAYFGALGLAVVLAAGLWKPSAQADRTDGVPKFVVDPSWPRPLPAPVGSDGVAHPWVQGEVAGTCVDADDHLFTVNRAWEIGAMVDGVTRGNQTGMIVAQDAIASAIPSPVIVEFDRDGKVVNGFGNAAVTQTGATYGGSEYMPYGSHGCFVDYQGNVWTAGASDGIVQKYAHDGGGGVALLQIGTKGVCDGPPDNNKPGGTVVYASCGEAHDFNSSHTLLNEPADVAVDPEPDPVTGNPGDVYIADGYGNHRVVVFDRNGKYLRQFGTKCTTSPCPDGTFAGTGGGHPHCVVLGNDHLVYACDRPNSRIEVWDKRGNFVKTIEIGRAPGASAGEQAAILKAGTRSADIDFWPNRDSQASKSVTSQRFVIDVDLGNDNVWIVERNSGNIVAALGACGLAPCPGHNVGHFAFSHTAAVDSRGNIYVGEVITGRRLQKFVLTGSDVGAW
jgi:hypothetical protein